MESWRDKLTRYLNDAMIDLVGELQPRRSDTLPLTDGQIDLTALPRSVVKVIALSAQARGCRFITGSAQISCACPLPQTGSGS
ncbi:MAG: hypothetical protein R2912_10060 [Eubacteriales bacterium]